MKPDLTLFLFKCSLTLCGNFPDLQVSLQAMCKHMPNKQRKQPLILPKATTYSVKACLIKPGKS